MKRGNVGGNTAPCYLPCSLLYYQSAVDWLAMGKVGFTFTSCRTWVRFQSTICHILGFLNSVFPYFRLPLKAPHLHQDPVATSTFFLFLPKEHCSRRSSQKTKPTSKPKETTMKLALIRSTCGSLRVHPGHQGSRLSGLSRRCVPVGLANSRLILRTASATSRSGGTSPKITLHFGQKEGMFECDGSVRSDITEFIHTVNYFKFTFKISVN